MNEGQDSTSISVSFFSITSVLSDKTPFQIMFMMHGKAQVVSSIPVLSACNNCKGSVW